MPLCCYCLFWEAFWSPSSPSSKLSHLSMSIHQGLYHTTSELTIYFLFLPLGCEPHQERGDVGFTSVFPGPGLLHGM